MLENNSTAPSDLPKASEGFGTVPHNAEGFRTLPNDSASFGSIPKGVERKEDHTLTVREVARMFEAAGVARTERSITNWCQPNKSGIARLDAYFDPNERKYFITPQSSELAIQEEKAKVVKGIASSELTHNVPKTAEKTRQTAQTASEVDGGRYKALEQEVMDLKITNRGKDYFIEELQKQRESFVRERQVYVEQLMTFNHKVGELETKLLQLEAPSKEKSDLQNE